MDWCCDIIQQSAKIVKTGTIKNYHLYILKITELIGLKIEISIMLYVYIILH